MAENWFFPLDNLAVNGVIDYDAPSFILDRPARYAGNPSYQEINTGYLPEGTKLKQQPLSDMFSVPDFKKEENPPWKKWLLGSLVLTTAAAVAFKIIKKFKK